MKGFLISLLVLLFVTDAADARRHYRYRHHRHHHVNKEPEKKEQAKQLVKQETNGSTEVTFDQLWRDRANVLKGN